MRILVTGTTGFIGSQLAPKLIAQGHDVYGLERYVTGRYAISRNNKIKTVYGDLRNHFAIKNIVKEVQPEIVIHLAAISPVSYSYDHPNEVIETNFLGTVKLAEACLREVPHFKQFMFASTSETYGNGPTPKKENQPLNPNSPYAVSKVAAEKYLLYMRDAYGFPVTIVKPFNTYGRKNNVHFVMEKIIVHMLQNKELRLGDPTPVRDFVYVNDHVDSYLTCLDNEKALGDVFNFCTGRGVTIEELVEIIRNLTGFEGDVVWNTIPKRPLDIDILIGDGTKAKTLLNWTPKHTLEDGLKLHVEYWKGNISK